MWRGEEACCSLPLSPPPPLLPFLKALDQSSPHLDLFVWEKGPAVVCGDGAREAGPRGSAWRWGAGWPRPLPPPPWRWRESWPPCWNGSAALAAGTRKRSARRLGSSAGERAELVSASESKRTLSPPSTGAAALAPAELIKSNPSRESGAATLAAGARRREEKKRELRNTNSQRDNSSLKGLLRCHTE